MNITSSDYKELAELTPYSTQSFSQQRSRRGDQCRALLVIFSLMLASGHNYAWLFFSKYLQTYLYYQMAQYEASPRVELILYFAMLIVSSLFMPVAANLLFKTPIKAVLCLSCVCILTGSISFIMCSNITAFFIFQSTFTAFGTSIFMMTAFLLAWEWFSPNRRGLMTGTVVMFQQLAISLIIALQIIMIEYKNLAPIEELKIQGSEVDIYPQKVAMKMILLYFVICGIQGIVTATVLAYASRNEVQQIREERYAKNELRVSHQQRKYIRSQIKKSNWNKSDEVLIYHPGQNCPAQYLTFMDAFRARQLHIIWAIQLAQSFTLILFCVQVIHTCSVALDKNHSFCKSNFVAVLTAALLSPLFGLSNDHIGVRINSSFATLGMAGLSLTMAQFELFQDFNKLWYLIVMHCFISWQQTNVSYACVHLFGIKCGTQCYAYVLSATVVAACAVLPILFYTDCFASQTCEDTIFYVASGLLCFGFLLSLLLNPKPLVEEEKNQFQKPVETYTFVSTHSEVQF